MLRHRKISERMDTKTKSAIKSFQRNNGLTVDGIAGEMTWRYIDIRVDTYSETHGKVPF